MNHRLHWLLPGTDHSSISQDHCTHSFIAPIHSCLIWLLSTAFSCVVIFFTHADKLKPHVDNSNCFVTFASTLKCASFDFHKSFVSTTTTSTRPSLLTTLCSDLRVSSCPYGRSVLDSFGNVKLKIMGCLTESESWWVLELNAMWWLAVCLGSPSSPLASEEPMPSFCSTLPEPLPDRC